MWPGANYLKEGSGGKKDKYNQKGGSRKLGFGKAAQIAKNLNAKEDSELGKAITEAKIFLLASILPPVSKKSEQRALTRDRRDLSRSE